MTTTEERLEENQIPDIEYSDFQKLDIRVAEVLTAEAVEKTDRLVKLTLDIGEENPATVVAGIREHYTPEQLVGRKVVYIVNLKPRKLRGIMSQGMVLAAFVAATSEPNTGTLAEEELLSLLTLDRDLPAGAKVS